MKKFVKFEFSLYDSGYWHSDAARDPGAAARSVATDTPMVLSRHPRFGGNQALGNELEVWGLCPRWDPELMVCGG